MKQPSDTITGVDITYMGVKARLLIFFSILFGLSITIFSKPLYELGVAVLQRHESSHGIFVPFISGYLIWLKLSKINGIKPIAALFPGSMMYTAGVLIFTFSHISEGIGMEILSFLLIVGGFILMLFGKDVFKEIGFPLFFLAAMIPLPESVYSQIAEWMRQTTTWGAVALVKLMGVHLYRDNFDIFLPNLNLYVDLGCSGVRYLLSYLVFGVAYGFLFKRNFKNRALVVIGAVPLSIVGGVLRLGIIFSSAYFVGPIMVEHRPHVLLSWLVFTVLLVGAIGMDRYILKVRAKKLR